MSRVVRILAFVIIAVSASGCYNLFGIEPSFGPILKSSHALDVAKAPARYADKWVAYTGRIYSPREENGGTTFHFVVTDPNTYATAHFSAYFDAQSEHLIEGDAFVFGKVQPERVEGVNAFGVPVSNAVLDVGAVMVSAGTIHVRKHTHAYNSWRFRQDVLPFKEWSSTPYVCENDPNCEPDGDTTEHASLRHLIPN